MAVNKDWIDEALSRTREQEARYGHNTGHFTLRVEKENTLIGTLGEIVAREALTSVLKQKFASIEVNLSELGSFVDLTIKGANQLRGVHVKTGLWKNWPQDHFSFGVHSDQGIQMGLDPLLLVSLLKQDSSLPTKARIEGFVTPEYLRKCALIRRGDRFPGTGVQSRTDNLITYFRDFASINRIA